MSATVKKIFSYAPILVAILSAFFVYWLLGIYGKAEIKREKRANEEILHRELDQNRSVIEQKITGQAATAKSLAEYVEFNPNINQEIFKNWAENIFLRTNSQALTFSITQNRFVEFEYPKFSGNLVKLNLKQPYFQELKPGLDSLNKVQTYFKPLLLDGKPAVVYQNYIFTKDSISDTRKFWGSAVIVDELEQIMELVPFKNTENRNFNVEISSDVGGRLLQVGDDFEKDQLFVSEFFKLQSLQVNLNLGNKVLTQDLSEKTKGLRILFIGIAILIAILNGYLIANMFSMQKSNKILAFKNTQIKAQLTEKVLLIKEIHHRIKNHFQLISSLNRTSADRLKDKSVDEIIEDINTRIELMAQAYDQINEGEKVNNYMPDYIKTVVTSLIQGVEPGVTDFYNVAAVEINIKRTVYIGILLNEFVINSLKHGFPNNNHDNLLRVDFKNVGDKYILEYLANGVGLPHDIFEQKKHSTGVQVLSLFTEQLEGHIVQIKDEGFHGYEVVFPV